MVLFNYSTKELTAKIVYYGPGLCGKTTNLQFIFESLPDDKRGRMLSLSTQTDRTLYFDFLPMDLGEIRGMKTRIQLYTVPGQVFYNETRKMVLKGVDGVVFVADSQAQMADANLESFRNLIQNLEEHGLDPTTIPLVLQFNKRDLPSIHSVEEMNAALNRFNAPFYEAIATTGIGVHDTLKAISKLVLRALSGQGREEPAADAATGTATASPTPPAPSPPVAEVENEMAGAGTDAGIPAPASDTWDDDSLESQLDSMDATEIEGLLQEVEGLDLGGEDLTGEVAPEPQAEAAPDAVATTVAGETAGEAAGQDDLVSMDGIELDLAADAGSDSPAVETLDGQEDSAGEIFDPDMAAAAPAAPGEGQAGALSFESFMADHGADDQSAATASAVETATPVIELVDGGQISIPVLLEKNGQPVRYTLTLRLQPEDPARS